MGMDRKNVKKGVKCFVDGPKYMGGKYSGRIVSYGIIEEDARAGSSLVTVHLERGSSGRSEFATMPICCLYETDQNKNIVFTENKK